jgi:integrase
MAEEDQVFPAKRYVCARGHERHLLQASLRQTFRRLLATAGLPQVRFHDLRHTHATLALLKTKNIKAVSARLGHSDIRVTLNTYAHFVPLMENELVNAMESLLTPAQGAISVSGADGADMPHNLPQNGQPELTFNS